MGRWENILYRRFKQTQRYVFKKGGPRAVILMYHRIGHSKADPWELFVSEENFIQQLEWLKKSCLVHPLSELDEVMHSGNKNKKHVFITFDDGCYDNFETAVPVLSRFHFPATFFIPTGILTDSKVFWWEALDFLFWQTDTFPEKITLSCGKSVFSEQTAPHRRQPGTEGKWSANREPAPTSRCRLYLALCEWIRIRTPQDQMMITEQLIKMIDKPIGNQRFFKKMAAKQINQLSKAGFEIGGHTVHHPALNCHEAALQGREISASKICLEKITGKEIVSFAYPHGEYDENTLQIMKAVNIKYACTTDWGAVNKTSNRLTMPRMLVRNTAASFFKKQLDYLFNS